MPTAPTTDHVARVVLDPLMGYIYQDAWYMDAWVHQTQCTTGDSSECRSPAIDPDTHGTGPSGV